MIMRTLLIALLFSTQLWADDNIISIEQTGDNLLLEFDQEGNGNKIDTVFGGVYLDTAMSQQGVRNQVLKLSQGVDGDYNQVVVEQWNNTTSGDYNKIWIDIDGNDNMVDVGQGCKFLYSNSTECLEILTKMLVMKWKSISLVIQMGFVADRKQDPLTQNIILQ